MKILIIGNGAREHAIAYRLRRENPRGEFIAIPGNPGLAELSVRCFIDTKLEDITAIVEIAQREKPDLVVVGPELPLSLGLVDALRSKQIPIVGPTKKAAQLESSKAFAKQVMQRANVPTARSSLTSDDQELDQALALYGLPVVLKADGLAAGKGVVVCHTAEELNAGRIFLRKQVGAKEILVEEFLHGVEATLMIATDGEQVLVLPSAHDYKRLHDGDLGPNTGGMGSVSPTPRLSTAQIDWCVTNIIHPVLAEMRAQGTPFTGFLYAGLMIDPQSNKISVVEFNARLGDPETQSVLAMLDGSFTAGLMWMSGKGEKVDESGEHRGPAPTWSVAAGVAVSVVAAADGYPGTVRTGDEIDGILLALNFSNVAVFQAGTKLEARRLITNGGRVLTVTARGASGPEATRIVYRALDVIQFRGRIARRDIGRELTELVS